jgi:AAA+ superfamily predicted ATPase
VSRQTAREPLGSTSKSAESPNLGLRTLLEAQEPLVYWSVSEEARAFDLIQRLTTELDLGLRVWSCLSGLTGVPQSEDLLVALRALLEEPLAEHVGKGGEGGQAGRTMEVVLLRDPDVELQRPAVLRALRDLAHREGPRSLVLVGRSKELPPELKPEATHLEHLPPSRSELIDLLRDRLLDLPPATLPSDAISHLAALARALPLRRVRRIVDREVARGGNFEALCASLLEARKDAVREVGVLELVTSLPRLEDIGGLEELKEWLLERRELFSEEVVTAGLPVPRGILLMGVSGCGKSLAAKACASLWKLPLYRLDMNLVFSGLHGSPEAAFHRALRALEAAAPLVLWIDELENGLGSRGSGGKSAPEHLFSAFLTWLQEKPPLVFVTATANRIELLPAEVLRKGRFDQVFFLDLPAEHERRSILEIHLRHHGIELPAATLDYLVYDTRGWSGAELEQIVIAARVRARAHSREPEGEDLIQAVQANVPLSRTMHEQVRALREWAYGRAVSATRESPTTEPSSVTS